MTGTEKKFLPMTENNDNEGETWRFWLQVLGNEDEPRALWLAIDTARRKEIDFPYKIADLDSDGPVSESEVDVLVKYSDTGYMAYEQKVTGRFICPADLSAENFDQLYKGGIKDLFS